MPQPAKTSKMPSPNELHGQCYCGRVQVRVQKPLRPPVNCHCSQCRRLSGAVFTTGLSIKLDALVISGEAALSTHHPTDNLNRQFCKLCGTHIRTLDRQQPGIAGLHAGTFEGQELSTPQPITLSVTRPVGSRCYWDQSALMAQRVLNPYAIEILRR